MKKQFYNSAIGLILLFCFTSVSHAQFNNVEISNLPKVSLNPTPKEFSKGQKSAWIGGGFDFFYGYANVGDHIFINASAFSGYEPGDKLTKVKLYHYLGKIDFNDGTSVTYTNTKYTIKIYENPVLTGDSASVGFFDTVIGTPVYQESFTLGADRSGYTLGYDLAVPYTITSKDFWVALSYDNGIGAPLIDGNDLANKNEYYRYTKNENDEKTYISNSEFVLGLSIFTDNGVYQTDIEPAFANSFTSVTAYLTTASISATQNLTLYPIIINNGPCDVEYPVDVMIIADKEEIYSRTINFPDQAYLTPGFISYGSASPVTLTAAQMNSMGLTGEFDITYTLTFHGIDPDLSNNTATLTVTRAGVGINELANTIAVSLYPNPATDILYVESSSTIGSLTICDISGRMIKQWNNVENSVEINDLASGIYLVKIQTPQGSTTQKIVKQ